NNPRPAPYPRAVNSPGGPALALSHPPTKAKPPAKPRSRDLLLLRDRNKDGFVTLKEFIGKPEGRNFLALTKRFNKMDANGDARVSRAEMKAATRQPK
ncbi:MAG: hypothetical protein ACI8W8_005053, partial [Rhodothermales bacterium]